MFETLKQLNFPVYSMSLYMYTIHVFPRREAWASISVSVTYPPGNPQAYPPIPSAELTPWPLHEASLKLRLSLIFFLFQWKKKEMISGMSPFPNLAPHASSCGCTISSVLSVSSVGVETMPSSFFDKSCPCMTRLHGVGPNQRVVVGHRIPYLQYL